MKGRWSEKRALNATLRRLDKIELLCVEIGGLWGDEDQYLVDLADDLRAQVRAFGEEVIASAAARKDERAQRAAEERGW